MFSMRIVNVDYYLCSPKSGLDLTYSQFRGSEVKSVPVIRIFGSTPQGSKTCLHVHGVFPYLLVPFVGPAEGRSYLDQLALSLDKAINISLGTSLSNKQHILKIVHVSGRPFYGYHGQDHQYLKIYFYNPLMLKKASELLQNGAVCGTQFQIHEGHVPFTLQFFIDYNLYGMSFINLKNVVYRKDASPPGIVPGTLTRESFCEIEADAVAVDILNRLTVEGELAVYPGLAAIWKEEKERLQKVVSNSSQRPTPQKTLSEMLLRDRLKENLQFQGKCRPSLKEKIPYPTETQRSSGSEILDASVLDIHSISSLAQSPTTRTLHEEAVVDEELVLSLTQASLNASTQSLDQSLLAALEILDGTENDEASIKVMLSQGLEDDSILGTQMMPLGDDDLPLLDYSRPAEDIEDVHNLSPSDNDPDSSFEEIIPQLDGVGDITPGKKRSKKKNGKVLVDNNPVIENNILLEGDETLINNMENGNCWPEPEAQEGLEEIFSDDEPFNSPIHSLEDENRPNEQDETSDIDLLTDLNIVLRGDPSFTSGDGVSSEDAFLQSKPDSDVWNTSAVSDEAFTQAIVNSASDSPDGVSSEDVFLQSKPVLRGDPSFTSGGGVSSEDVFLQSKIDSNVWNTSAVSDESFSQAIVNSASDSTEAEKQHVNSQTIENKVSVLSNSLVPTEMEKQMALPSCSEELLNTCHLDEIFNEDLNKGLDIIYESNSQHDSTENFDKQNLDVDFINGLSKTIYTLNLKDSECIEAILSQYGKNQSFLSDSVDDELFEDHFETEHELGFRALHQEMYPDILTDVESHENAITNIPSSPKNITEKEDSQEDKSFEDTNMKNLRERSPLKKIVSIFKSTDLEISNESQSKGISSVPFEGTNSKSSSKKSHQTHCPSKKYLSKYSLTKKSPSLSENATPIKHNKTKTEQELMKKSSSYNYTKDKIEERPEHKNLDSQTISVCQQKSPSKRSFKSTCKENLLLVKWIKNKNNILTKPYNSYEMTGEEIERYFSQLDHLTSKIGENSNCECSDVSFWTPLRELLPQARSSYRYAGNKRSRNRKKRIKPFSLANVMKQSNITEAEMIKLTSCSVQINRLATEKVTSLYKTSNVSVKSNILSKKKSLTKVLTNGCKIKSKSKSFKIEKPLNKKAIMKTSPINKHLLDKISVEKTKAMPRKDISKNSTTEDIGTNDNISSFGNRGSKRRSFNCIVNINKCEVNKKHMKTDQQKTTQTTIMSIEETFKIPITDKENAPSKQDYASNNLLNIETASNGLKNKGCSEKTKLNNTKIKLPVPLVIANKKVPSNKKPADSIRLTPVVCLVNDVSLTKSDCKLTDNSKYHLKNKNLKQKKKRKTKKQKVNTISETNNNTLKGDDSTTEQVLSSIIKQKSSLKGTVQNEIAIDPKNTKRIMLEKLRERTNPNCERSGKLNNVSTVKASSLKTEHNSKNSPDVSAIPLCVTPRVVLCQEVILNNSNLRVKKNEQFCSSIINTSKSSLLDANVGTKENQTVKKAPAVLKSGKVILNKIKCKILEKQKKMSNILSLDGTIDSSSSDESVSEKKPNFNTSNAPQHCNTPNKRRQSSSKTNQTPKKNYVPLNIEIKKSPTAKSKRPHSENMSIEKSPLNVSIASESRVNEIALRVDSSDPAEAAEKRRRLEPVIKVQRLSLPIQCEPSTSAASDGKQVHPLVKRLEVSVKRLSCDFQECPSLEDDPLRLKRHSSDRRVASKEPNKTTDKMSQTKEQVTDKSSDDTERCTEVELSQTKSDGKKSRKSLLFPQDSDGSSAKLKAGRLSLSSEIECKNNELPMRRFSSDIFESHGTPESNPEVPFNLLSAGSSSNEFDNVCNKSLQNSSQLIFDFEGESIMSNPFDSFSEFKLSQTQLQDEGNKVVDTNPLGLEHPTLFTPFIDPPSRADVISRLSDVGLPEVVNKEPFFSDPADVNKSCEVGGTVLKLKSKSVVHLEEFVGTFNCRLTSGKEKHRIYRDKASHGSIVVTPLLDPPSASEAKSWLKTKLIKKVGKQRVEYKEVKKITVPSSPDHLVEDDDDNDCESLTLSQATPLSKASVTDSEHELVVRTPGSGPTKDMKSSPLMASTPGSGPTKDMKSSPLMASTPVNEKAIPSTSKRRFPRMSLSVRKSLPLIKEEEDQELTSSTQADSVTETVKQLSETGVKRLLSESRSPASVSCQIETVTPNNSGNYRMDLENLQDVKLNHEVLVDDSLRKQLRGAVSDRGLPNRLPTYCIQTHQYLTILTMELHVHTRGELRPNPDHDAVCCLFYNITNDCPDPATSHITGVIYVSEDCKEEKMPQLHCTSLAVPSEQALIMALVALVRKWDPDILVGYEIELLSWGYLLQRAYILNVNLASELSRVKVTPRSAEALKKIHDDDSELQLTGRIVLNLWRFLRHEVALQSYTFENIVYHVLHQRIPLFSFRTLTSWWSHRTKLYRWLVFEHYLARVEGIVSLMQQLDLVGRTSEFARLFGIQFYEVLSRGSQFRVESMMLRLVKPLNYVPVSPSVQQRSRMRAPESLPLIMEPQSRFYSDPVIVLDFQSLYPSIIIAYNYCFCTCLGRVEHLGRSEIFEFGCTQLRVPVKELTRVKNNLNFSPCGVAFVNQSVVKGVLPRMLEEILNTRLMVKQSMKEKKDDKTLQRVLHARQLGLKLIANVTYGYTAANFSGRMPCIEVGDSVVSKARETLERAISMVNQRDEWGVRVIYGDTDSLFVQVPGRTRAEAFRIGAEIAEAVTNDNPRPIKLKLEKVYQPCLLQTKKRYVGYMYESPNQESPVYDAKGIETVRRDGCPAVSKILEKSLRLLFESRDVSLVKRYACRQFSKVQSGRISVQELTFAREYRGAAGYRPGACVPALELAKQWRVVDPRAEPRVGERVPYVVVAGPPGLPLIRLIRSPRALLSDPSLKINAEYYITRVIIPPLERCFSLIGANVVSWFSELPRKQHLYLPSHVSEGRKATISQYFATSSCVACQCVTAAGEGVCVECRAQPQQVAVTLASTLRSWQRRAALVDKLCQSCCGRPYETDCTSLDCPVLYRRFQVRRDLGQEDYVLSLCQQYLAF